MKLHEDSLDLLDRIPTNLLTHVFLLEQYTNAAIIQWHRIFERLDALTSFDSPRPPFALNRQTFVEVHFFWIASDKVQNLVKALADQGDAELAEVWRKHKQRFRSHNAARNHLEHIDERLTNPRMLSDLANLHLEGDRELSFSFGGTKFDVGRAGLAVVTDAYEDVISVVRSRPSRSEQP